MVSAAAALAGCTVPTPPPAPVRVESQSALLPPIEKVTRLATRVYGRFGDLEAYAVGDTESDTRLIPPR